MKWPKTRTARMEYALWILVLLHISDPEKMQQLIISVAKGVMP